MAADADAPCTSSLNSSLASEQISGAQCAAEKGADEYASELLNLVTSRNPDEVRLEAAYALSTIDDADKKDAVASSLMDVARNSGESPVIRYAAALTLHTMIPEGDDRGQEVTDLLGELSEDRDELLQDLTNKLASARTK